MGESSMLVSAKKFGGCNSVKYDCANTNTAALLATYEAHSTVASPPPEGGPAYTYVNDVTCGAAPNTMGMRLFDADMPSMAKSNLKQGLTARLCYFYGEDNSVQVLTKRATNSNRTCFK